MQRDLKPALLCCTVFVALACGATRSPTHPGDPLYTVEVKTQGESSATPKGAVRALLQWQFVRGGPFFDCINLYPEPLSALQGVANDVDLIWGFECMGWPVDWEFSRIEVGLRNGFPGSYQLDIRDLPKIREPRDEGTLAFGRAVLYDDRNGNQELDGTDAIAMEPVDAPLAASPPVPTPVIANRFVERVFYKAGAADAARRASDPRLRMPDISQLVYRDGNVHPFWRFYRQVLGCPNLPMGFSLMRIKLDPIRASVSCELSSEGSLDVRFSELGSRWAVCSGTPTWAPSASPYPENPPPKDAVVTCAEDGASLEFYRQQGAFCDPAFVQHYELEGCKDPSPYCPYLSYSNNRYQFVGSPPTWWPCEFTPVCKPPIAQFKGTLQVGTAEAHSVDMPTREVSLVSDDQSVKVSFSLDVDTLNGVRLDLNVNSQTVLEALYESEGPGEEGSPLRLEVTRYQEEGASRVEGHTYQVKVHALSMAPCGMNVVQITSLVVPALGTFPELRIEGTYRFEIPER